MCVREHLSLLGPLSWTGTRTLFWVDPWVPSAADGHSHRAAGGHLPGSQLRTKDLPQKDKLPGLLTGEGNLHSPHTPSPRLPTLQSRGTGAWEEGPQSAGLQPTDQGFEGGCPSHDACPHVPQLGVPLATVGHQQQNQKDCSHTTEGQNVADE